MPGSSLTDIYNAAAVVLSQPAVESPSENSRVAGIFGTVWNLARRAFLADGLWNQARRRVSGLLRAPGSPPFGFLFWFVLPNDYIQAVTINSQALVPGSDDYRMEIGPNGTQVILTNIGTVNLEYISDNVNYGTWSPKMVEAAGYYLARFSAKRFGKAQSEIEQIEKACEKFLLDAKGTSGQENYPTEIKSMSLIDAMSGGTPYSGR
jgi:hypothetical protein